MSFYLFLALNPDNLFKELSSIKDKWRSIGEALKVSGQRLDQFVDLSEPLLEVIVHWLKGGEDVSWDVVVDTLRSSSINETEIADKINRIYCDHRKEEKEIDEKKMYADTGES